MGEAGHSHTHRVGEMSHSFDVEELLKYELQLILCALGRPGRGAAGVSSHLYPLCPPCPRAQTPLSRHGHPCPGWAASFSTPYDSCRRDAQVTPSTAAPLVLQTPMERGQNEPHVSPPGPWGAPSHSRLAQGHGEQRVGTQLGQEGQCLQQLLRIPKPSAGLRAQLQLSKTVKLGVLVLKMPLLLHCGEGRAP